MLYLLLLVITTVFFQLCIVFDGWSFGGTPAVAGWAAILLFLPATVRAIRARRFPFPALWIPLALAAGRLLSSMATGRWGAMTLVGVGFPLAVLYWQERDVAWELRRFGIVLAGLWLASAASGYTLLNRNLLAHCLLICLAAYLPDLRRRWRPAGLLALALVLSSSRGALLGLAAMAAAFFPWGWVAIPAMAAGLPLLLRMRQSTTTWRLECWRRSLALWLRNPWMGAGPGVAPWPEHAMGTHAHNLLLNTLIWSGVVGVVLLAAGAGATWLERKKVPRWATAGLAGAAGHYLVDDFDGSALALALTAGLLTIANPTAPARRWWSGFCHTHQSRTDHVRDAHA